MSTILLVEDDLAIQQSLAEILELEGYKIICASDGQEAIDKLDCNCDLILLDLMLPKRTAAEIIEEARKKNRVPAVLLCSADSQIAAKAERLQVRNYIAKPFDIDALIFNVRQLLP